MEVRQQRSSGVIICAQRDWEATNRLMESIKNGHQLSIAEGHVLQDESLRRGWLERRGIPGDAPEPKQPALEYESDCQDCVLKDAFDHSVESGPCSFAYVEISGIVPFYVGSRLKVRKDKIRRAIIGLSDLKDSKYNLSYYVIKARRGERVTVS